MGPVATAIQGKGLRGMMARARTITSRYGLTAYKMDRILGEFVDALQEFGCGATFPTSQLQRSPAAGASWKKYQAHNIEFAVHGYYHVDHSLLSLDEQIPASRQGATTLSAKRRHLRRFPLPLPALE